MHGIFHRFRGLFFNLFGGKKTIRLGIYGETNTGKTTLANRISMDWLGEPVGKVSEVPHETRMVQKKEHIEVQADSKKLVINLLDMPGLATKVDYKSLMKYRIEEDIADMSKSKILSTFRISDLKKIAKHRELKISSSKTKLKKQISKLSKKDILSTIDELKLKPIKKKGKRLSDREAKKWAKEATEGIIEAIKWLDNVDTVLVVMDSTRDPYTQVNIMLIGNLEAKNIPIIIVANKIDLDHADIGAIRDSFPQHPTVPISALRGDNLNKLYDAIARHSR